MITTSLGGTAFVMTGYFDIKANKLNNTLRRAIQKNSECQRAPKNYKRVEKKRKAEKELVLFWLIYGSMIRL